MRVIRNIITALSFTPVYFTRPAWLYETTVAMPYDHSAMDDAWSKNFHAWN